MRRLALLLVTTALACQPKGSATPPAPANAAPPAAESAPPQIDPERLFGVIEHLASDDLGGRFTLSPDIDASAKWLAAAFEQASIAPVGSGYRHDFTLVTGARTPTPPALAIGKADRPGTPVASSQFAPFAASPSGEIDSEIVFVGYAAQSSDDAHVYDDLAGVDVKGKVALVLMHQPNSPDVRAFFSAMRERRQAFEEKAAPLRAKDDLAGLRKLHAKALDDLLKLASPWIPRSAISAEELAAVTPEDPKATLDTMKIAAMLTKAGEKQGPAFEGFGRLSEKVDRLAQAGAVAVIAVEGPRSFVDAAARKADALPVLHRGRPQSEPYPIPVIQMQHRAADSLVRVGGKKVSQLQKAIDTKLVPASGPTGVVAHLQLDIERIETKAPNILATIPGTEHPEEIVLFGAHFDHIGREGEGDCHGRTLDDGSADGICNGADDNASGTAVVLEIARAMAEAKYQPKRSIVFALFSGEELGLLGSKALAAALPTDAPFAGGEIVAMVNIDMVGRLREPEGLAIGGVASGDTWMQILDDVGTFGMPVLYDRAITTRSDHAAFYEKNIPVLFLFTHTHDDYHAPGDESALINKEGLADIARLVQGVAVRLGDGQPIHYVAPKTPAEGLTRALPGTNPDTVEKRVPAATATAESTAPAASAP